MGSQGKGARKNRRAILVQLRVELINLVTLAARGENRSRSNWVETQLERVLKANRPAGASSGGPPDTSIGAPSGAPSGAPTGGPPVRAEPRAFIPAKPPLPR